MKELRALSVVPLLAFFAHCGGNESSRPQTAVAGNDAGGAIDSAHMDAASLDALAFEAGGQDASVDAMPELDAAAEAAQRMDAAATVDAAVSDASAVNCGNLTCGAAQVCVTVMGSGGPSLCVARNDAGACPAGTQYKSSCPGMVGGGCAPLPHSQCVDVPAACSNYCGCIPSSLCAVDAAPCSASGKYVTCSGGMQ